ncbi:DUF1993 domain-containing protein [Leptospira idonii]|uniref:DUF1993 domain-containing protein n=1 Tax=Leptospira idonii TaxID=1193500 RepID=A0A4R9LY13_9LEPT|nr:DUF1993 domain-containing protein [Leptospira idonii]TGN19234.1 DUF1993 domain-containing protein [Leptospira idonii]
MIYEMTALQFAKMLRNLSAFLDKSASTAEAKKIDFNSLLSARLAPDQFDLTKQIQIACDNAKIGVARLTGKTAPKHEDNEKTLPELQKRIGEVLSYLADFSEQDFKDVKTLQISLPWWEGKRLSGEVYAIHHLIPNFYFHITTAYSILRHNLIDLGKKDYLGVMPFE